MRSAESHERARRIASISSTTRTNWHCRVPRSKNVDILNILVKNDPAVKRIFYRISCSTYCSRWKVFNVIRILWPGESFMFLEFATPCTWIKLVYFWWETREMTFNFLNKLFEYSIRHQRWSDCRWIRCRGLLNDCRLLHALQNLQSAYCSNVCRHQDCELMTYWFLWICSIHARCAHSAI